MIGPRVVRRSMGERLGTGTTLGDAARAVRERSDLLLPTVSLLRVVPGPQTLPGEVVGFGVLATAFFALVPTVFPDLLDADDDVGFRLLFAAAAVSFAVAFEWTRSSLLGAAMAFGTYFGAVVAFDAHLAYRKGWNLRDVDGPAVSLVDGMTPNDLRDELAEDFDRRGWRRRVAAGAWLGALGTVFAVPAFLAGLLGTLIGTAFPLPDLLLVAVVSFNEVTESEYDTDRFGLNRRLYAGVREATRSFRGLVFAFLVAYGVVLSMEVLVHAVRLTTAAARGYPFGDAGEPTFWNVLGYVTVIVAVAAYDLWVWIRAVERFPASTRTGDPRPDVPQYPRGLTLPPTLALLAVVALTASGVPEGSPNLAFALLWPFLVVWLGYWAVPALSSVGTVSPVEIWGVVGALLVQSAGRAVVVNESLLAAVTDPFLVFSFVVVPLLAFLPDVVRYATSHDDARRYATGCYLIYVGGMTVLVSVTASGEFAFGIGVLATVILAGGAVLVAAEYLVA